MSLGIEQDAGRIARQQARRRTRSYAWHRGELDLIAGEW